MNWFSDTPSRAANYSAAALSDPGSINDTSALAAPTPTVSQTVSKAHP